MPRERRTYPSPAAVTIKPSAHWRSFFLSIMRSPIPAMPAPQPCGHWLGTRNPRSLDLVIGRVDCRDPGVIQTPCIDGFQLCTYFVALCADYCRRLQPLVWQNCAHSLLSTVLWNASRIFATRLPVYLGKPGSPNTAIPEDRSTRGSRPEGWVRYNSPLHSRSPGGCCRRCPECGYRRSVPDPEYRTNRTKTRSLLRLPL